jgi:peptidoglycan/xylan/chitin deacetylase (PgdA/CDA1 family)
MRLLKIHNLDFNHSLQRFYDAAQRRYPDILFQGNPSRSEIALTFDDGPHPGDTSRLLDVLARHHVRATFFLIGTGVKLFPEIVRQIHGHGHQLALHGYRHTPFPLENPSTLRSLLNEARNRVSDICGIAAESIRDVRPPYGAFTRLTVSMLSEWGYRLVMWNCIPPHWMQPVHWSIRQVMDAVIPGGVIVLHDGHGHGRRVTEIVEAVVPRIKSLGLDFLTVEEMQNQRKKPATAI